MKKKTEPRDCYENVLQHIVTHEKWVILWTLPGNKCNAPGCDQDKGKQELICVNCWSNGWEKI